jgi:hypothetical protein
MPGADAQGPAADIDEGPEVETGRIVHAHTADIDIVEVVVVEPGSYSQLGRGRLRHCEPHCERREHRRVSSSRHGCHLEVI